MNLRNKKTLAAKTLNVGKERIIFVGERLEEIKEALTKQDVKDLFLEKAIQIKPIKGRRKIVKRKNKKGAGNIKKKVKKRKQEYVKITRKLRNFLSGLKSQGEVSGEEVKALRKKIRNRDFKNKQSLKNYLEKGKK